MSTVTVFVPSYEDDELPFTQKIQFAGFKYIKFQYKDSDHQSYPVMWVFRDPIRSHLDFWRDAKEKFPGVKLMSTGTIHYSNFNNVLSCEGFSQTIKNEEGSCPAADPVGDVLMLLNYLLDNS